MTPTADRPPLQPLSPLRRLPLLAGLIAAVLLGHALLLIGWPVGLGAEGRAELRRSSVRQIVLVAAVPMVAPAPSPAPASPREASAAPAPTPAPAPMAAPAGLTQRAERRPEPTPEAAPGPAVEPAPATEPGLVIATPATTESPEPQSAADAGSAPPQTAAAAPVAAAGESAPTYATRLPPPALLRYELRRGPLTGQGELIWRPDADGYVLRIEGTAFGLPILAWASRGGFDAAGLAPQRFVDRRRGRGPRAANFQRDKGLISYSGSAAEHALLPGAQDRLSWMVQLAAIVEADPARFVAGQHVSMLVSGARGDAEVWAFAITAVEPVDVAGGRIEGTLALRREPRKPFDTLVEVWLDPMRHHLPVRLKLSTAGGGDSLEFLLEP